MIAVHTDMLGLLEQTRLNNPVRRKFAAKRASGQGSSFLFLSCWEYLNLPLGISQGMGLLLYLDRSGRLFKCPTNIYHQTRFFSFRIFQKTSPRISLRLCFHSTSFVNSSIFRKNIFIMELGIPIYMKSVLFLLKKISLSSSIWTKTQHLLLKMLYITISWMEKGKLKFVKSRC